MSQLFLRMLRETGAVWTLGGEWGWHESVCTTDTPAWTAQTLNLWVQSKEDGLYEARLQWVQPVRRKIDWTLQSKGSAYSSPQICLAGSSTATGSATAALEERIWWKGGAPIPRNPCAEFSQKAQEQVVQLPDLSLFSGCPASVTHVNVW